MNIIKEVTIKSPANIAFIKYWGQKDKKYILPFHDSFSMNLSNCYTTIQLSVHENPTVQELSIKEYKGKDYVKTEGPALHKVKDFYTRAKEFLHVENDFGFILYSKNSFPKKAGIASSASFFSALTLAFTEAFGEKLSQKQLSVLARLSGSGSACRSIPDGFSWWNKGNNSNSSYSVSIAPPSYWDLVDLVVIVTFDEKKISSSEGHQLATTSPFFSCRIKDVEKRLQQIKQAFLKKDFTTFGKLLEEDTISMHAVMMTQQPPLYFWSGATVELIKKTIALRGLGTEAYFTIDAGENVHIICQEKDEETVYTYFKNQEEVQEIIKNEPTIGARVIKSV